jgi:SET domain-containing protein
MLLVKTKLDVSPIHGIGLFADQFIPKGTVIWEFNELIDLVLMKDQIEQLAENARQQIEKYSYRDIRSRQYILCGDDARFFNHSDNPNCYDDYRDETESITFTRRDIAPGEELTCNYALFDLDLIEGKYRIPHSEEFISNHCSAFDLFSK